MAYLFTALKIAAPVAVITAFVAEYFGGSQNGLGYGITSNAAVSRTAASWAYVVGACLLGLAFYLGAVALERLASPAARATGARSSHQTTKSGSRLRGSNSMNKQRVRLATAAIVAFALVGAACGSDDDSSSATSDESASTDPTDDATDGTEADGGGEAAGDCEEPEPVSLQLQWFTQAQFAGYFAAQDQGFYEDMCLDVTIVEGGVEIVPQTQLANGDVDFALAWVPKALASREAGADIINIAQIYQRSGTLQVSFVDAGITTPGGLRRQEDRQLGLRQRVRGLRRHRSGGARPGDRCRTRRPAVRHGRAARRGRSTLPRR